MADIARPEISPSPSKVGRILSSIRKFAVDSTLADFLAGINGRKKLHEFVQQEVKGSPLPLRGSNPIKSPWDIHVIVHDVQEVVRRRQEEAVKLHERCDKSMGGLGTDKNRVFIHSRL